MDLKAEIKRQTELLAICYKASFDNQKLLDNLAKEYVEVNRVFKDGDIVQVYSEYTSEYLHDAVISDALINVNSEAFSVIGKAKSGYNDSDFIISYRLKKLKNDGTASKHRNDPAVGVAEKINRYPQLILKP